MSKRALPDGASGHAQFSFTRSVPNDINCAILAFLPEMKDVQSFCRHLAWELGVSLAKDNRSRTNCSVDSGIVNPLTAHQQTFLEPISKHIERRWPILFSRLTRRRYERLCIHFDRPRNWQEGWRFVQQVVSAPATTELIDFMRIDFAYYVYTEKSPKWCKGGDFDSYITCMDY